MQYNNLCGERVSNMGFGTLRLPKTSNGDLDTKLIKKMVDTAMEGGINYYDLGYSYGGGRAEVEVGKALSEYSRDSYYIIDKIPSWRCKSNDDVRRIFEEQLHKCGVDYFDFYLIHSIKEHRFNDIEKLGIDKFLVEQKQNGRINYIGASIHGDAKLVDKVLEKYRDILDFVQIQQNYIDWYYFGGKEIHETALKYDIPITVMEPLRGGMLAYPISENARAILDKANSSYPSLGYRFVRDLPEVKVTLSGSDSPEQISENIRAFNEPALNENDLELIKQAAQQLDKDILIPCTACDYCSGCPAGIKISSLFKLYNGDAARDFNCPWTSVSAPYFKFEKNANDCLSCHACEKHCPQGISIVEQLKKIDEKYRDLRNKGL